MLNDELNSILKKFTAYVVQQSRSNLSRQGKNNTKGLYNSIKGGSKVSKNSIALWFEMKEHGEYQDKGVKGADPSQVSPNAKIKGQQAPNSKYKFKNKRPPSGFIEQWAKSKNIRLRDKNGKFTKGNYKSLGIIIAKNIWARGLKPSMFFTKPFEKAYKSLPTELIDKYGLTMEDQLLNIIKDI
jgi:hypothetical protein